MVTFVYKLLRKVADRSTADTWLDPTKSEGFALEQAVVLAKRLAILGVDAPPPSDFSGWRMYLPLMAAYAETKDLRAGRTLGSRYAKKGSDESE